MNEREVLNRLDLERRSLARAGEVIDVLPAITRLRAEDDSRHHVIYSSLTAATADAAIAREIDHHRALGVGVEWKLYAHDEPHDLFDRLRRHGFDVGPREAVLVYDLAERAAWIDAAGDASVVRIEGPEQIDLFRQAAESILSKDYTFTANELAAALATGSTQHRGYIAYADGLPASIGRLYTHPESHFGGLYGGGTLKALRGRGLYRAVVAARARDAAALGARYLIVDALPTSCPILERMGFHRLTETWPCEWKP